MKAFKQVFQFHAIADGYIDHVRRKSADAGKPVSCLGMGCSACCYEPVYCEQHEISHALARLSPKERKFVTQRTREWVEKLSPSGLLSQELPNAFAWRSLKAPCPFLMPGLEPLNGYQRGFCLIYPDRPFGCRMHCAIGSANNCFDDTKRPEQEYMNSPEVVQHMAQEGLRLFTTIENDHLGVWCAEILLRTRLPETNRQVVKIES